MIFRNYTPFHTQMLSSRDVAGGAFRIVVLRGTFVLAPGQHLGLAPEQAPMLFQDRAHGALNASSPYLENDLAPFKPRTDILVNATAQAPHGLPAPSWEVGVRVGVLEKRLRVTGPRAWEKEDGGAWRLSNPEPCATVPIRYESAFGGTFQDPWAGPIAFDQNPLGRGYLPEGREPPESPWPAPQIESLGAPVEELGKLYRPEGLGPLGRSWEPRSARAGTRDEAWLSERCPRLPLDFDFAYHNAAHPDLIYPGHLRGDEEVTLEGLHPDGDVRFTLPALHVGLLLRLQAGPLVPVLAALDTLMIDVPEGLVHLSWRAGFSKELGVRVVEARMNGQAQDEQAKMQEKVEKAYAG